MLCRVCQEIFRTGLSPLSQARLAREKLGFDSPLRLPFTSEKYTHHKTTESLQNSAAEGCYICLILLEDLSQNRNINKLPQREDGEPFTTYRLGCTINNASKNPNPATLTFGPSRVSMSALPAKGEPSVALMNIRQVWLRSAGLIYSSEFECASRNTGSRQAWTQVLRWLKGCIMFHTKCNQLAPKSLDIAVTLGSV
jgi:hypothetical protein